MKKILFLFFALFALFLPAAEFSSEWNVRLLDKPVMKLPVLSSEKFDFSGKDFKVQSAKNFFHADVAKIAGCKPAEHRFALITGEIVSKQDESILLGVGADFFYMLFVNGKCISSTMGTGNSASGKNISPENQMQVLDLKAGKNEVKILLKSGTRGFLFTMAPKPLTAKRANQIRISSAEKSRISFLPILTLPGTRSCAVLFRTPEKCYAELEYREKGTEIRQKVLSSEPDAGVCPTDRLQHRFVLKNLIRGKEYEFQSTLITFGKAMQGPSGRFVFEPETGKDFSFFATSDTQYDPNSVRKDMLTYRKACGTDICAFYVHLGDMTTHTVSYEKEYYHAFFDPLTSGQKFLKPFVLVRGNHEFRGDCSSEWIRQFGTPERKGYYAFRRGKYCFIVLDTGEDKTYQDRSEYPVYMHLPHYLKNERRWLEEYVKSDEFKTSEYRIVLAHAFPQYLMAGNVKCVAGGILFGKGANAKIHLWMAGHVHRYQRFSPGSEESLTVSRGEKKAPAWKSPVEPGLVPFTVVVGDGPNAFPKNTGFRVDCGDTIRVSVHIPDGSVIDRFEIGKNGRLLKSEPSDKLMKRSVKFVKR